MNNQLPIKKIVVSKSLPIKKEPIKKIIVAKKIVAQVSKYKVDDLVLAKWYEDNLFYDAKILSILPNTQYNLVFTEYGNEQVTNEVDIHPVAINKSANTTQNELENESTSQTTTQSTQSIQSTTKSSSNYDLQNYIGKNNVSKESAKKIFF